MLFIDGKWETASSGRTFDSCNPANGEKLGEAADADRSDAERAVRAAQEAFGGWSRTTVYERSALLYEAWRIMMARRDELAELMTAEQGKPLRMAATKWATPRTSCSGSPRRPSAPTASRSPRRVPINDSW